MLLSQPGKKEGLFKELYNSKIGHFLGLLCLTLAASLISVTRRDNCFPYYAFWGKALKRGA